jgi:hypothetical protein
VEIQTEPPTVNVRDEKAEAETNKLLADSKILSPQTWAAKAGLEYEQEQENIERHEKDHPDQMQQAELGLMQAKAMPQAPAMEQLEHCGANGPGGKGFQPGNTCGSDGKGDAKKPDKKRSNKKSGMTHYRGYEIEEIDDIVIGGTVFEPAHVVIWKDDRAGRSAKTVGEAKRIIDQYIDGDGVQPNMSEHFDPLQSADRQARMEAVEAYLGGDLLEGCGANGPGGGGFQPGNTCASDRKPGEKLRDYVNRKRDAHYQTVLDKAKASGSVILHKDDPSSGLTQHLAITPSAQKKGSFQLTQFDKDMSPVGHTTHDNLDDAVRSATGMHTSKEEPPIGGTDFLLDKPESLNLDDPKSFTPEKLPQMWAVEKASYEANPKLSPNRAGELAAAKVLKKYQKAMGDFTKAIDRKDRDGLDITDEESELYDLFMGRKWSPSRVLSDLSGSRSIIADMDEV